MAMKLFNALLVFIFFLNCVQGQVTYQDAFPNIKFDFPVEMQNPADGTDRMFVVEQEGIIKVFPRSVDVTSGEVENYLDITGTDIAASGGTERGLLGLAFHPDYSVNGHFFVFYTADSDLPGIDYKSVLARFTVSASDPNFVDPTTQLIIFEFDKNQDNGNHNGGKIAFGPDGYLYVSIGDGGGANDPNRNAQNVNNVFGSILRIDIDLDGNNPLETNPALPDGNYEIPSDNPFVTEPGLDEIFAYGIRNTWKFSFDFPSNRLWGADVGQDTYEEINIIENGKNYGWSRFESDFVRNPNVIIDGPVENPVYAYERIGNRSITGGYVYRGSEIQSLTPSIDSTYIYGDYVSGRVWALTYDTLNNITRSNYLFQTKGLPISSFGVDIEGEIYFSSYGTEVGIYKLVDGDSGSAGEPVDGIGVWSTLDVGFNGDVQSIETSPDGTVFFAGDFSMAGNIAAQNIVSWKEDEGWENIGDANGSIRTLKWATDGSLYAGGSFTEIGGVAATNIAKWDGSSWSSLGTGISGTVDVLELDVNNILYAAGIFESLNGDIVRNIAFWDGNNWSGLVDADTGSAGTNNEIRSLAFDENNILYVGGNFDIAGGKTANNIAAWNGSIWGSLGDGTIGFVEAITTTDADIFVGGNFVQAGGKTVNRVARWDKANGEWFPLGLGVSNIVTGLIHDGINLYAAGSFSASNVDINNSIAVNGIAQWSEIDGWRAMGTRTTVGVNSIVNDLEFSEGANDQRIFVGGSFSTAGIIEVGNIAIWDLPIRKSCFAPVVISEDYSFSNEEASWSSGVFDISCFIEATISMDIEAEDPSNFEASDYINVYYKLDGGSEIPISENVDGFDRKFISADVIGDSVEIIIRYKTSQFNEVYKVYDLMIDGPLFSSEEIVEKSYIEPTSYPNPFSTNTTISYEIPQRAIVSVSIFNLQGQLIKNLIDNQDQYSGVHTIRWETDETASEGIYIYKIKIKTAKASYSLENKLILVK